MTKICLFRIDENRRICIPASRPFSHQGNMKHPTPSFSWSVGKRITDARLSGLETKLRQTLPKFADERAWTGNEDERPTHCASELFLTCRPALQFQIPGIKKSNPKCLQP